jgi:glucose-6-phosphate isomerase
VAIPHQRIFPGRLEDAYRAELDALVRRRAIEKIRRKEADLWKAEPEHARVIGNRLGWLDSIEPMQREAASLAEFAREIRAAGFAGVVLLGMGGSSLAPEVFALVFPPAAPGSRLFVLDSTDPASVLGVERSVDWRRTFFLVASKSGSTIETLSQFRYFHDRVARAGVSPAGANFIAITDAGSKLDLLAGELHFRRVFRNAADIGGRYSALSYFGLVPAALWGVPLEPLLNIAGEMKNACGPAVEPEANPALALGALLGAGAKHGFDKLALLATPALASLGNWVEQLVAESTGKEGKGILPIAGEIPGAPEIFSHTVAAVLALRGETSAELESFAATLRRQGFPVVNISFESREQLGAEFLKWELATAVAGASLGVNPFDEPNVTESKDNTSRLLAEFEQTGRFPPAAPALAEAGIEVFAEGAAASLAATLAEFFARRRSGDYLALLAFLDRNAENTHRLEALRVRLRDALRMPVTLGFGPRYLHSIGQFYKGGPPAGMFVLLTAASAEDAAIPGAKYSFAQLEAAQALGDLEAITGRKKPALHLHFTQGGAAGLAQLERAMAAALESIAAPRAQK